MKIYEDKFCLDEHKLSINLYYLLGIMLLKIPHNLSLKADRKQGRHLYLLQLAHNLHQRKEQSLLVHLLPL